MRCEENVVIFKVHFGRISERICVKLIRFLIFQKNSILKPQNRSEFHGRGSLSPKTLKSVWSLIGIWWRWKKSLPWGRYGYFLEIHNIQIECNTNYYCNN